VAIYLEGYKVELSHKNKLGVSLADSSIKGGAMTLLVKGKANMSLS
jgi:hypothetical protein